MELADHGITEIDDNQLDAWLARWDGSLVPMAHAVQMQRPIDMHVELPARVLLLGHEPDRAPLAFAFCFFEGVTQSVIDRYEALHGVALPRPIAQMLHQMNGAFFLDLSVYGIPLSMASDPPLLCRSGRNPLDIATAARAWRAEFQSTDQKEIHFASRNTGWDTQVGYFMRPDGAVVRYPRIGKAGESKHWPSLQQFLTEELAATCSHRPILRAEVKE